MVREWVLGQLRLQQRSFVSKKKKNGKWGGVGWRRLSLSLMFEFVTKQGKKASGMNRE